MEPRGYAFGWSGLPSHLDQAMTWNKEADYWLGVALESMSFGDQGRYEKAMERAKKCVWRASAYKEMDEAIKAVRKNA